MARGHIAATHGRSAYPDPAHCSICRQKMLDRQAADKVARAAERRARQLASAAAAKEEAERDRVLRERRVAERASARQQRQRDRAEMSPPFRTLDLAFGWLIVAENGHPERVKVLPTLAWLAVCFLAFCVVAGSVVAIVRAL